MLIRVRIDLTKVKKNLLVAANEAGKPAELVIFLNEKQNHSTGHFFLSAYQYDRDAPAGQKESYIGSGGFVGRHQLKRIKRTPTQEKKADPSVERATQALEKAHGNN
jgi:hypothetical protein